MERDVLQATADVVERTVVTTLPEITLNGLAIGAAVKVHTMFTPEMRATLGRLFGVFGLIVLWWVAYEHNDSIWVFFARDHIDLALIPVGGWGPIPPPSRHR